MRSRKGEKAMNPVCFCGSCSTIIKENVYGEIWCEGKHEQCLKINRPRTADIKQAMAELINNYYGDN